MGEGHVSIADYVGRGSCRGPSPQRQAFRERRRRWSLRRARESQTLKGTRAVHVQARRQKALEQSAADPNSERRPRGQRESHKQKSALFARGKPKQQKAPAPSARELDAKRLPRKARASTTHKVSLAERGRPRRTKALVQSAVKPDPRARLPPRHAPAPEMQATQDWRARSPAQNSGKPASRGGHAPPSFRHPHGSRAGLPPGVGYEARTGRVPPPGGCPHRDDAHSGRAQGPRGCPLRVGAPSGSAHPPEVRTHRGGVKNWLSGSGRIAHG